LDIFVGSVTDPSRSIVNVLGGSVTGVIGSCGGCTGAQINVSGGQIQNLGDRIDDFGSILMTGGNVAGTFTVSGQNTHIAGGSINELILEVAEGGNGSLTVSDGVIGTLSAREHRAPTITGGEFLGRVDFSRTGFTITGGAFHGDLSTFQGFGEVIAGGAFLGSEIYSVGSAVRARGYGQGAIPAQASPEGPSGWPNEEPSSASSAVPITPSPFASSFGS
jgi:hypothetical protein